MRRAPSVPSPTVLYNDGHLLIVDKPAGLPCHAGASGSNSVELFFPLWSRRRHGPWLVHRLDRDTAGCLVVALRREALLLAQCAFQRREVAKTYWAILDGRPRANEGVIDAPLAKHRTRNTWRMVADNAGQDAITQWRVLGETANLCAVEFRPMTGRTHQIRAHAQILGCPLIGDAVYGQASPHSLQLLARSISLGPASATARIPGHMSALLKACGISPAETTDETAPSPAKSVA